MKKKRSFRRDILYLSASSFVLVAAWIGFNLYHSWVTTTITPELQVQIVPIDPNFDMATFEKLKTRKRVQPVSTLSNDLSELSPTPESAAEVSTTPVPSAVPTSRSTQPVISQTP